MTIDLKNDGELNFDSVRKLLSSGQDDIDMEIRVSDEGIVFLSEVTGPEDMFGICFRIGEMNMNAGDGEFLGPNAAAATDDILVHQVVQTLQKYWPNKPHSKCVPLEAYRDQ